MTTTPTDPAPSPRDLLFAREVGQMCGQVLARAKTYVDQRITALPTHAGGGTAPIVAPVWADDFTTRDEGWSTYSGTTFAVDGGQATISQGGTIYREIVGFAAGQTLTATAIVASGTGYSLRWEQYGASGSLAWGPQGQSPLTTTVQAEATAVVLVVDAGQAGPLVLDALTVTDPNKVAAPSTGTAPTDTGLTTDDMLLKGV